MLHISCKTEKGTSKSVDISAVSETTTSEGGKQQHVKMGDAVREGASCVIIF